MALNKAEVLLMLEDVLVYGFKRAGLPYFHDDDLSARRLFTPSVGEAVLRFRCANERAYVANVRKQSVQRLLEPTSRVISHFAKGQVDNIFANREENFMRFFRYLAFILDLTVFAHRYKKIHVMNPVFVEGGAMFDAYLSAEIGLPFWRNFIALCDTVLRNSPEHGRPIRHFRNPAIPWDPKDPACNPDDPSYAWLIPDLRLHPDHPILKPDRHAFMNKFWSDVKASERGAENTDEGDEYLNLGIETLNLSGKSSDVVDRPHLGAEGSNVGLQGSCFGAETSNLVVQRANQGAEGSDLVVERSNVDDKRSVIDVENSNLATEDLKTAAVNPSITNTGDVNTAPDENLNLSVATSSPGGENLNLGNENSNSANANPLPGAENTHAPNPDHRFFNSLLEAMQWDIQDIVWNTDPQDPALK